MARWTVLNSGGGSSSPGGPAVRTLVLNDLTVGNYIAHPAIIHHETATSYTVLLVAGALRKTITSDLSVRLNVVNSGVTSVIGTFTIPHTTAISTAVTFTTFTTSTLPNLSVITADITASDGSSDPDGVAAFSLWYQ